MILQRYTFGSKSQPNSMRSGWENGCLWYCKDIHLEANHNCLTGIYIYMNVVYDIAKIYIWKQITTRDCKFSRARCCLWYCKDIHLEANHNLFYFDIANIVVVYDIAKIYIWKQITTKINGQNNYSALFMILQRYTFGSKSQHFTFNLFRITCCLWYCKDIHLEANHNSIWRT